MNIVVVRFSLRIHRKPTLPNTLSLLENFKYRPKTGKTHYATFRREKPIVDSNRQRAKHYAENHKRPPTTYAEIILALNDQRMKNADDKKDRKTQNQARNVIVF